MFFSKQDNWLKLFRYDLWPFGHALTLNKDKNSRLVELGIKRLTIAYPELFQADLLEKDRKNVLRLLFTGMLQICQQNHKQFSNPNIAIDQFFIPYSQLSFNQRAVVFLRHRFNCSFSEIAFLLSLTLTEVTSHLNRGRKSLLEYSGQEIFFSWK